MEIIVYNRKDVPMTDPVKAQFRADDGNLLGFALTGTKVPERTALSKELQPIMA